MIHHSVCVVGLLALLLGFACGPSEQQEASDSVATPIATATARAEDQQVTMTPTQVATTAPPMATATQEGEEPATVRPTEIATTAPPMATATQQAEEPATMTPAEVATKAPSTPTATGDEGDAGQGQRVALSGVLDVIWGDPPPDSGLPPRMEYVLSDKQGQHWSLVFDRNVFWPPGGPLAFNGKQVKVEGRLIAEDRILVNSIGLE